MAILWYVGTYYHRGTKGPCQLGDASCIMIDSPLIWENGKYTFDMNLHYNYSQILPILRAVVERCLPFNVADFPLSPSHKVYSLLLTWKQEM